jgi:conserved oligomeric Golgi complex subunit 2
LADLRSDLQARSDAIAGELHTLVNDEYAAFLSLGAALRGGEERCQEVKVGVMGFDKGVATVRNSVIDRRKEVERLLIERGQLIGEIANGRSVLAVAEKMQDLEGQLEDGEWDSEDEDEDEESDGMSGGVLRLKRLVSAYLGVKVQVENLGSQMHATLLASFGERLANIRKTLLIDLGTALKQAKASKAQGASRLLQVLELYGSLDATQQALQILKSQKT